MHYYGSRSGVLEIILDIFQRAELLSSINQTKHQSKRNTLSQLSIVHTILDNYNLFNPAMDTQPTSLPQKYLRSINQYFRNQISPNTFSVDPENHKLHRKHGVVKNFMRLTNKTLIGINRFRINRAAILSGFLGLAMGYICSQADDQFDKFLANYRPSIKDALIKEVLRNKAIKLTLSQALLDNVYTNPDIQYNLAEVLISKAIIPQQSDLLALSKRGILQALQRQQLLNVSSRAAAQALLDNRDAIGRLALQFLGGSVMQQILREEVSSLLGRQDVNEEIVFQLKRILKQQLSAQETREMLYSVIREKFIN